MCVRSRKSLRGFTLIELMIVIAIIAVLAAILIPNFLHARAESQTTACEGNEKQIATSLEEYAVDTGGIYPASGVVTPALFGANPYMNTTPTDPVSGAQYHLTNPAAAFCNSTAANSYDVTDGGQHDKTVQIANGTLGDTSVVYCSGAGLTSQP
ncbi:MAG: prepilin-type N-terminal cleavage/methylation domain-containing protein [Candidatus Eremiobacteraeota bacterium]|nr:prepilin-type N-terminal cleavage/methylation domain-containing protein [Candidatus Eremiobacteraeota bacterium]MBV8367119.1 prepilin-type N-terminal cleavage/methylation domain-containing protein [Candidatus Eremiobacteraeota bacterium]